MKLAAYYVLLGLAVWALVRLLPTIPQLLERFRSTVVLGAAGGKGSLGQAAEAAATFSQGEWALVTLLSGFWLYQRLSGGAIGALLKTPVGLASGWEACRRCSHL